MSRIYFHSKTETAEVSGRERAYFGNLCTDALLFSLGDLTHYGDDPHWILKHVPEGHYLHDLDRSPQHFQSSLKTWLAVGSMSFGDNGYMVLNGKKHPLFDLQLNTAQKMGGNALKLAARIHGQCEIHLWVDGPNRMWLADMIEDSCKRMIFRREQGWDSVVKFLLSSSEKPVVCSYSVCEQFPNCHLAEQGGFVVPVIDGERMTDAFYDLSDEDKWNFAFKGLTSTERGLELKPDGWEDFWFGESNVTGFDFRNAVAHTS